MKGSFFIQYLELFGLEWNRIMFHGLEYLPDSAQIMLWIGSLDVLICNC